MIRDPTLGKPSVGQLALSMAHRFAGQYRKVDGGTATANCSSKPTLRRQLPRLRDSWLLRLPRHVVHKAATRHRRVETRVLQVDVLCIRPERTGKGLRQHANAHATNQVAVLKYARKIGDIAVGMRTTSNATANQVPCAAHTTGDASVRSCKPSYSSRKLGQTRPVSSWRCQRGVRVTAHREMRPGALQHHRAYAVNGPDVLHSKTHFLAQSCAERVEVLWIVQL